MSYLRTISGLKTISRCSKHLGILPRRVCHSPPNPSSSLISSVPPAPRLVPPSHCVRFYSRAAKLPGTVDYDQVKKHIEEGTALVVDVRTDIELVEEGRLNGSIHIPLGSVKEAFDLEPDQFEKNYKVRMPEPEDAIIFSCLKGVRSAKAEVQVRLVGYKNTSNYIGGFADWRERTTI